MDIVDNVLYLHRRELESATIVVDKRPPILNAKLLGGDMQAIIENLVSNSIYWLLESETREPAISIECERESEFVTIRISDNGPGIAEDIREHIFEPYYSSKDNGRGLGLTIASDIATDFYEGSLEVMDDGPLPGACFKVRVKEREDG
jgi:C4-dicarboxylate-specific signal transduction histidine kinase